LLFSPDKQIELVGKAADKWARYVQYCVRACTDPTCPDCIEPLAQDARFRGEAWQHWPFNAMYQGFLLSQQWWHNATTDVEGVWRRLKWQPAASLSMIRLELTCLRHSPAQTL